MNLTPSEIHHLQAAEGFLDLGMHVDAFDELEEIEPLRRAHPVVLLMRSRVYLAANRPEFAHPILTTLTTSFPDLPDGWFFMACAHAKRREIKPAEHALKQCLLVASKTDNEKHWSDRAISTKDLDALWCSNQMNL